MSEMNKFKESHFTGYFDPIMVNSRGLKRKIFLLYYIPSKKSLFNPSEFIKNHFQVQKCFISEFLGGFISSRFGPSVHIYGSGSATLLLPFGLDLTNAPGVAARSATGSF